MQVIFKFFKSFVNSLCVYFAYNFSIFILKELKIREDGVVIVYKDGGSVTEFLDGTRISTYVEFSGEKHFDFVKV